MYVNGKKEQAINMLTKWHGYGNVDSAWVKLQLAEYDEFLNMEGADKRWWDYRAREYPTPSHKKDTGLAVIRVASATTADDDLVRIAELLELSASSYLRNLRVR